jgi:hypothetical protein
MNSWDVNLRNGGEHVTSQPTMMVDLELFLSDTFFLKKSVSSGISPFAIKEVLRVGEDELTIVVLSTPESPPASLSIDELVGGRLLGDSVAMEFKAGVAQQRRE